MKNGAVLFKVFVRSFFIQAIWNFERMQNIGFAYGILPFVRLLYPDPAQRREVLLRHIGFFNTHPYMVNIIFGMVASLEEDMLAGRHVTPEHISALKNNMAGPLAAIGDTFFWATWRSFTVLLGISFVLFFNRLDNFLGTWLAPLSFLVIYNVLHLPFRYWSLKASYQLRTRIVEIIANLEFQYAVDLVRFMGLVVLVIVLLFYLVAFTHSGSEALLCAGVFLGAILAGCFRVPAVIIFYAVVVLSLILNFLRG